MNRVQRPQVTWKKSIRSRVPGGQLGQALSAHLLGLQKTYILFSVLSRCGLICELYCCAKTKLSKLKPKLKKRLPSVCLEQFIHQPVQPTRRWHIFLFPLYYSQKMAMITTHCQKKLLRIHNSIYMPFIAKKRAPPLYSCNCCLLSQLFFSPVQTLDRHRHEL